MITIQNHNAVLQAGPLTYSLSTTAEGFLLHGFAGAMLFSLGDSNAPAADALSPDPNTPSYPKGIAAEDRAAYHPPRPNSTAGQITPPRDVPATMPLMPRNFGPDSQLWEFPTSGLGDYSTPALGIRTSDGNTTCDLRVRSMRILDEKPRLKGLPGVRQNPIAGDQTMEVLLYDEILSLELQLLYTTLPEYGVIARSARVTNRSHKVLHLTGLASLSLDLPTSDYLFGQLSGAWARERHPVFRPLSPGLTGIQSRRGMSGPEANPLVFLAEPGSNEVQGQVFAAGLVYSGNFSASAEVNSFAATRLQIGINPQGLDWPLAGGESFQSPEAWLAFSNQGFGPLSRRLHRLIREDLCISSWSGRERPILVNNWEATYFDFSQESLLELARAGAEVGAELFVLDDGWFGDRQDDTSSLGDWRVNTTKLPEGLAGLGARINDIGLSFGLWMEPEMVSPNSNLFQEHPEWCIHIPGRNLTLGRNQLVLDLARREVQDWIIETVDSILSSAPISYIKWDMNRPISESSPAHSHSYILGLYRILEHLTLAHPDVLFEGCAAGGGRFDLGMLAYLPQYWTSDNTDAIERLAIQWGTSLAYPTSTMASHVSAVPNHQVGRLTPLLTRAVTAFWGIFGYELDLPRLSQEERQVLSALSSRYKQLRPILQFGDLYRLEGPTTRPLGISVAAILNRWSWMLVSQDKNTALVSSVQVLSQPNPQVPPFLKLQGLNLITLYTVSLLQGPEPQVLGTLPGSLLTNRGIALPYQPGDFQGVSILLEAEKEDGENVR